MLSKDEIIEMARQAGFLYGTMGPSNTRFVTAIGHTFIVELEAFAKLVAAQATAKECEACAQICDDPNRFGPEGEWCASVIRARGQK